MSGAHILCGAHILLQSIKGIVLREVLLVCGFSEVPGQGDSNKYPHIFM